jgi:hypothetical protein
MGGRLYAEHFVWFGDDSWRGCNLAASGPGEHCEIATRTSHTPSTISNPKDLFEYHQTSKVCFCSAPGLQLPVIRNSVMESRVSSHHTHRRIPAC